MSKSGLWVIAAIAVATLLYLVYLAATFEAPAGTTTVILAPPAMRTLEPEAPPPARPSPAQNRPQPTAPVVEVPEEQPAPAAVVETEPVAPALPVVELPSLNESDDFVFSSLREFQNGVAVINLLARDQIVRKFVVLVENLSRGQFPQTALPYRSIGSEMPVENIDENLFVMDEAAFVRFNQVVDTFVAVDATQAMTLYRILSPLFQQAYAEIGYRDVNFDDTLRSAITNVLRTTDVAGPYQLVKPSVMYLYADASIENLEDVHKQLVRLGPENTEKVKASLRAFLRQL